MLARILGAMEQNAAYNALNFNLPYTHVTGANFTGCATVISSYLCPSSVRDTGGGRDTVDTKSPVGNALKMGYGVQDYGAPCYTDIDAQGKTGGAGSTPVTPYRNNNHRADGVLKVGKTTIAEIIDGTSNSIMIAEDAGRDARFIANVKSTALSDQYDAGLPRRFWRWAEPDGAFGVSGQINNKYRPACETMAWPDPSSATTTNNNAGNNDEIFSYHSGGANVLMGDGSVRFLKESLSVVVLRSLITPKGGEVISSDAY